MGRASEFNPVKAIEKRPMSALKLVIRDADHLLHSGDLSGPLELGRQRKGEPPPSAAVPCPLLVGDASTPARLIIAPTNENNVGRQHVLLEPLHSGAVRVHNGSQIALPHDNGSIAPGKSAELTPPFTLKVSSRSIKVLPRATTPPRSTASTRSTN